MPENEDGPVARFLMRLGIVENVNDKLRIGSCIEIEKILTILKASLEKQSFTVILENGTNAKAVLLNDIIDLIDRIQE